LDLATGAASGVDILALPVLVLAVDVDAKIGRIPGLLPERVVERVPGESALVAVLRILRDIIVPRCEQSSVFLALAANRNIG